VFSLKTYRWRMSSLNWSSNFEATWFNDFRKRTSCFVCWSWTFYNFQRAIYHLLLSSFRKDIPASGKIVRHSERLLRIRRFRWLLFDKEEKCWDLRLCNKCAECRFNYGSFFMDTEYLNVTDWFVIIDWQCQSVLRRNCMRILGMYKSMFLQIKPKNIQK